MSEQLQGNPFEGLLGGGATVGAVSKPRRRKSAKELGWQAAYRARNRERLAAYGRAYYARNREKLLAYGRQYRAQLYMSLENSWAKMTMPFEGWPCCP